MDIKNLKLKSYGKWNLGLAALNFVVAIVCWNPFALLSVALGGYLVYDSFEKKPDGA